jgi:antitoxin SocA-like protein
MTRHRIRPSDGKLRELILLIAEWSQSDPKFGAIKLNKLLFHCDFSAFLTYGKPITGQEYFALPQGPAPRRLVPVTEKMKRNEELAYQNVEFYGHMQKRPIALRPADLSLFSATEIELVRNTVEKFWKLSATEISDQSHLFLGWKAARERETIPYSTALIGRRPPTARERKRGLALQSLAQEHLRART